MGRGEHCSTSSHKGVFQSLETMRAADHNLQLADSEWKAAKTQVEQAEAEKVDHEAGKLEPTTDDLSRGLNALAAT